MDFPSTMTIEDLFGVWLDADNANDLPLIRETKTQLNIRGLRGEDLEREFDKWLDTREADKVLGKAIV